MYGGLHITTDFNCEDGNTLDGDGCSAQCKVEKGYNCKTPDETKGAGICKLKTKLELKIDPKSKNPLLYQIDFSKETNLNYNLLSKLYTLNIEPTDKAKPEIKSVVFNLTGQSRSFLIELDGY